MAGRDPDLDQDGRTRLAAARLLAAQAQPYLAVALYAMTPVADPSQPTFAVDEQWRLYVNPARLAEWPVAQTAGVLLHEVGHLIRDHAGRARVVGITGEESVQRWNVAADAEINDDLLATGAELPPHPVTPQALGMPDGKVAEYYHARLGPGTPTVPDCGSGCHGSADAGAASERQHGLPQALPPGLPAGLPPGLPETAALLLRKRVAEHIARLAGQGAGTVPGGWLRWAQAARRPRLDWRTLLRAKIRSSAAAVAGAADYSYARPARRRVDRVVLPALRRPLPRVAIVIDTSGSVDDDLLGKAWTEVHGCLKQLGVRRDLLRVYAGDTDAQRIAPLPGRAAQLPGGGGTDMAQAMRTVLAERPAADLLVVITDGLTPWPARRPRQEVVIALLTGRSAPVPVPPWANVVYVADSDA